MATLMQSKKGWYYVRFSCRVQNQRRQFFRACRTKQRDKAEKVKARVDDACRDILLGRLSLPDKSVDLGQFILSGGNVLALQEKEKPYTFDDAVRNYFDRLPLDAKDASSLKTEEIHVRRLRKTLPTQIPFSSYDRAVVEDYVKTRREGIDGKPVKRATITKEICTLRQIWTSAKDHGIQMGQFPTKLSYPKDAELPPFETYARLSSSSNPNWHCLVLSEQEILSVLSQIAALHGKGRIHAMLSVAAMTGCRRSELLRMQTHDVDFEREEITIREKKKRKARFSSSTRNVQMHARLIDTLKQWFVVRGNVANPEELWGDKVKSYTATSMFAAAISKTDFPHIRGFHTFRHSFISILANEGMPDSIIDTWVGHTTEETRRRYRHLIPDKAKARLDRLFAMPA